MTLSHTYYRILVLKNNKEIRGKCHFSLYRTLTINSKAREYPGLKNSSQRTSAEAEVRTQCLRHINTHVGSSVMVHRAD